MMKPPAEPDAQRLLAIGDGAHIGPLLDALDCPLAEYSFANLFLFRGVHRYRFVPQPLPCVVGITYDRETHAMPLVEVSVSDVPKLLDLAQCVYPLPQHAAEQLATREFVLRWNDADSDYVYAASELATLAARELRSKRSQARSFEQQAQPIIATLDCGNLYRAREVLELWSAQVPRARQTTDYDACAEALQHFQVLGMNGILVSDAAGTACAFLLARQLGGDSMAVHFAKGNRNYAGVYPYLFSQFAARAGVEWLNFEQDLGAPGLRQAKRALKPAHQLRKYRLSRSRS